MKKNKNIILYIFLSLILLTGTSFSKSPEKASAGDREILFPAPFAFAIDDLGWNTGRNDGYGAHQGPYRIGVDRKMDINDYKCIIDVARASGVRVMGLFILGEMDRENILSVNPTTTWMGAKWDNTANLSPEQKEIMNYVRENAAWLEFGLHGLGHEYWIDGQRKRAEWYNTDDNQPWPEESLQEHLALFKDIMAQYGLSPENGQSFPESFVPCAYSYYWNPEGEYSLGSLLAAEGVKYANTQFDYIPELNPPAGPNGGGIDHGVLVLNRNNYGNPWYQLSSLPTVPLAEQESDIIESHWSNWLAQDAFLQDETNARWIEYYRMVQSAPDRYTARNTEQFYAQWLYKKYTRVAESGKGRLSIDNSAMPGEVYSSGLAGNMVLKIKLGPEEHLSEATLDGKPLAAYSEDQGYGFIYLPVLEPRSYQLRYSVGKEMLQPCIINEGTYNVYSFEKDKKAVRAQIRLYGTQEIRFHGVDAPAGLTISSPSVTLLSQSYDPAAKDLTLNLSARDMQGETFDLTLLY